MMCDICTAQIQHRKCGTSTIVDHADDTAPPRQHQIYHTLQISNLPALEHLDHGVGIDDLPDDLYDDLYDDLCDDLFDDLCDDPYDDLCDDLCDDP